MWQVLLIVVILLAIVAPIALTFYASRRLAQRKVRNCPYCGASGEALSLGRYRCSECKQVFIVGLKGTIESSIWGALKGEIVFAVLLGIIVLGISLMGPTTMDFVLIGLLVAQQAVHVISTLCVKNFQRACRQ